MLSNRLFVSKRNDNKSALYRRSVLARLRPRHSHYFSFEQQIKAL